MAHEKLAYLLSMCFAEDALLHLQYEDDMWRIDRWLERAPEGSA